MRRLAVAMVVMFTPGCFTAAGIAADMLLNRGTLGRASVTRAGAQIDGALMQSAIAEEQRSDAIRAAGGEDPEGPMVECRTVPPDTRLIYAARSEPEAREFCGPRCVCTTVVRAPDAPN